MRRRRTLTLTPEAPALYAALRAAAVDCPTPLLRPPWRSLTWAERRPFDLAARAAVAADPGRAGESAFAAFCRAEGRRTPWAELPPPGRSGWRSAARSARRAAGFDLDAEADR